MFIIREPNEILDFRGSNLDPLCDEGNTEEEDDGDEAGVRNEGPPKLTLKETVGKTLCL